MHLQELMSARFLLLERTYTCVPRENVTAHMLPCKMQSSLSDCARAFLATVATGDGSESLRTVSIANSVLQCTQDVVTAHPAESNLLPLSLREISLFSVSTDVLYLSLLSPRLGLSDGSRQDVAKSLTKTLSAFKATERSVHAFLSACASLPDTDWHRCALSFLGLWASVLSLPRMDPRLVDRGAPWLYAGLLTVARTGTQEQREEAKQVVTALTLSLPRNVSASALLCIASDRLLMRSTHLLTPAASPAWLPVAGAVELSRVAMLQKGVEGILDALFHAIPMDNPVAVERAQVQAAAILARPPSEIAAPHAYYAAIAPQVTALMHLGGGNAQLFVNTASLIVINALAQHTAAAADSPDGHGANHGEEDGVRGAVWGHVLHPLLAPLLLYSEPVGVQEGEEKELADEERVLSCVEDLHRLISVGLLHPSAALSLLCVTPALLCLYRKARAVGLRAGLATACREVLTAIVASAPVSDSTACLQRLMSGTGPSPAPRHPSCAYITAGNGGYRLLWYGGKQVDEDGREEVADEALPALRLHSARPATASSHSPALGLQGLLSVLSGTGLTPLSNTATSREGQQDPMAQAQGLGGVNPQTHVSAQRANALVDVCVGLKGRAANVPSALFTELLSRVLRGQEADVGEQQLMTALTERLGPRVLRSSSAIAQTVVHLLSLCARGLGLQLPDPASLGCSAAGQALLATVQGTDTDRDRESDEDREQVSNLCSVCLGLLTLVLSGPDMVVAEGEGEGEQEEEEKRDDKEAALVYGWVQASLVYLAALSQAEELDPGVREMSSSLRAMVLTLPHPSQSTVGAPQHHVQGAVSYKERIHRSMTLVLDPLPALQANGLLDLARVCEARPGDLQGLGGEVGKHMLAALLDMGVKQLDNSDTYVVLAAVELLAALASNYASQTLPPLLRLYAGQAAPAGGQASPSASPPLAPAAPVLSLRARVKLGESLVACIKRTGRSGSLASFYSPLLACMARLGIAGWREFNRSAAELLRVCEQADGYGMAQEVLDQADLRASALAGVAEIHAWLDPSTLPSSLLEDVLGGVMAVLTREGEGASALPQGTVRAGAQVDDRTAAMMAIQQGQGRVRRSAALVLSRLLLPGAGPRSSPSPSRTRGSTVVDQLSQAGDPPGQWLRDVYRLCQDVSSSDPDPVVRGHALDALHGVDSCMATVLAQGMQGGVGVGRQVELHGPALPATGQVPSLAYTSSRTRVLPTNRSTVDS